MSKDTKKYDIQWFDKFKCVVDRKPPPRIYSVLTLSKKDEKGWRTRHLLNDEWKGKRKGGVVIRVPNS